MFIAGPVRMVTPLLAADRWVIAGYVKDSSRAPQMGAVVEVFVSAANLGTTVFTDSRGLLPGGNLPPALYQVKVTAASFLPSLRENIILHSGAQVIVNLTLNTLARRAKIMPARRSARHRAGRLALDTRSAANRPILRVLENRKDSNGMSGAGVVVSAEEQPRRAAA